MLRDILNREGVSAGRRHVATLMKRMGIEAIYRRPNTSKPAPANKIYPYLLRGLKVESPNQVWAMDITYIPMARGFVYLAAVVDWLADACSAIACRSRWRLTSASRRWRRRWRNMASRGFSTRSGQPIHQRGVHQRADRQQDRDQHGWQGRLARQCLRRAHLEIGQV